MNRFQELHTKPSLHFLSDIYSLPVQIYTFFIEQQKGYLFWPINLALFINFSFPPMAISCSGIKRGREREGERKEVRGEEKEQGEGRRMSRERKKKGRREKMKTGEEKEGVKEKVRGWKHRGR